MSVIIKRTLIVSIVGLAIVLGLGGCVPLPARPTPEPTATMLAPTPPPTPTPPPPTAMPGLTPEQLMNGIYLSEFVPGGKVTLADGKFEVATGSAATEKVTAVLLEPIASGDLDGDGMADAAVILSVNTGGTGAFRELHVMLNQDGQPVHAAAIPLGDRVQIKVLAIQHGAIIVDMLTHGPKDALCCPTMAVVQIYKLEGKGLALLSLVQKPTIRVVATAPISPTLTFIPPEIVFVSPREGETIISGAVVSGTISITPASQTVSYQVVAGTAGQVIGTGTLPVQGEVGRPGTFMGAIQFMFGQEQVGRLEVAALDVVTGKALAQAVVNVRLAGK